MVDIDNDIRKKHDLRTTDGKAAAKKEQVKRNNENYFLKMIIDRGCIPLAGSSKTHIISWLILIPI